MLSFRISRNATRQLNLSSSSILQRVQHVSSLMASSKAFGSVDLPFRYRPIGSPRLVSSRGFAAAATTSKPRTASRKTAGATKKKSTETTETTTKKRKTSTKKAKKRKTSTKKAKKPVKKVGAKRPKKPLTEEEKQKVKLRELKVKALGVPHKLPATAWNVLSSEVTRNAPGLVGGVKEASVKYKNLLPEEREHYNHVANENKTKNNAAYKAWIQSFTPDQIRVANNARAQLRRLTGHPRQWTLLQDDRQVKRPTPPRLLFNKDRWASGDFAGMKVTDVPQLLLREWNALPAEQKKAYEQSHKQAQADYYAERVRVYGENSRPRRRRVARTDSNAAAAQLQREANA